MVDVVVVGSGPTGLVLAGELALAGVDVTVVEQRRTPELVGSRAGGFHSRTIELLDQRGIADRFLAEGRTVQVSRFAGAALDVSDFPTRHPYTLGLWQNHIERLLRGWVDELGVPIRRGVTVTGFAQDADGVDVRPADGAPLRAAYLVGADGGRSVVRRAAGIDFVGCAATASSLVAEVEVTEQVDTGLRPGPRGVSGLGLLDGGPTVRMVVVEPEIGPATEPTLADLRTALIQVYGTDFGVHAPTWISRFTNATRQAAAYRDGRVLLAGDAAHIHSPAGGQGIGLGVHDAVNLGWKLAQVVEGVSGTDLLDTYHRERHAAGARVLDLTMALAALQQCDPRVAALAGLVDGMLGFDGPRRQIAGLASGLDVAHDLGVGHPLLGRRMPDLDLVTADGAVRVFSLLHDAKPVLLDLAGPGGPGGSGGTHPLDVSAWGGRVRHVVATTVGPWELPVVGAVPAPAAALVRPDGHVAWVGDGSPAGLVDAVTRWFGPPATS